MWKKRAIMQDPWCTTMSDSVRWTKLPPFTACDGVKVVLSNMITNLSQRNRSFRHRVIDSHWLSMIALKNADMHSPKIDSPVTARSLPTRSRMGESAHQAFYSPGRASRPDLARLGEQWRREHDRSHDCVHLESDCIGGCRQRLTGRENGLTERKSDGHVRIIGVHNGIGDNGR
jgi:hypothetical protein